jgi:uncharacterized coiled-coil DUF342 family protein
MKTSYEKFMASSAVQPVELGEHKVELATINDLNARVQKTKAEITTFNSEVAKLQSIAKTQSTKGTTLISALEDILDMYNELSADFKKIGIDVKSSKELQDARNLFFGYYNGVKQLTQEMKNIL